MNDLDQWIFIYRDSDSPLAADNIFFSLPYKKVSQFKKDNPGFSPVVSYGLEHLLEEWGVLSRLKQLESEKAGLAEKVKQLDRCIANQNRLVDGVLEQDRKLQVAVEALTKLKDERRVAVYMADGKTIGTAGEMVREALARIEHGEKPDGILKKK